MSPLRVTFVTEGDPQRISGGFLYERRLVELAPGHDAVVRWVSVPPRRYPLAVVDGPAVLRDATTDADVVVIDSLASGTLGPWIALGGARSTPMVASVHQVPGGVVGSRARRTVRRRADHLAYARARRVVVPSELLAGELAAQGMARDRLVVVPPGRDVPEGAGAASGPPVGDLRSGRRAAVLCVANWLAPKGILEVLDAVARLPEDAVTLHLVGDEDVDPGFRDAVLSRLRRADLVDRVRHHGLVQPAAIDAWYAAADVFVMASSAEVYGMVYAEAMAAGLPVVGWAAGNLPNLVDDGVEGRVLPTGDVRLLSAALAELADSERLRARLGQAARRRAAALPTWAETAARFFAVCRAVASGQRTGRAS